MLLAIETSCLASSVALLHEGVLKAEVTVQARLTHSEQLMPHIADMLTKAAVSKKDVDGVAVSVGPGSFTGLRIGLATAKGLAFAWKVPLVGVETPRSLAWNFVDSAYAVYSWREGKLYEDEAVTVMAAADVINRVSEGNQKVVFCGDGASKFADLIASGGDKCLLARPHQIIPRAGALAVAAQERFDKGDTDDCMTLTPAYKRRSEAEVLWEKRHGDPICP